MPFLAKDIFEEAINTTDSRFKKQLSFTWVVTFRFLTKIAHRRITTAMINHVTKTDSATGMPPKIGIVKLYHSLILP